MLKLRFRKESKGRKAVKKDKALQSVRQVLANADQELIVMVRG